MAWRPIAGAPPQIDASDGTLASGYFLKFYASGTTTPINMATDSTGGTTLAKCQINSSGYPINGSSAVFIPYIDQKYRLVLYTNSTDADANTFANADWDLDAIDYAADIRDELANTSSASQGDALIGVKRTATGAVATTLHDWMEAQCLNVKEDFGAAGDDATDDTDEIQAGIDALEASGGGVLFFPAGTYLISGTSALTIQKSNITLLGEGQASVIHFSNWQTDANTTANGHIEVSGQAGTESIENVHIRDMKFTGDYTLSSGRSWYSTDVPWNCIQFGQSSALYAVSYSGVERCYFTGIGGSAIGWTGGQNDNDTQPQCKSLYAINNYIDDGMYSGVDVFSGGIDLALIQGNTIRNVAGTGILFSGIGGRILGNYIEYAENHGITSSGGANKESMTLFADNVLYRCGNFQKSSTKNSSVYIGDNVTNAKIVFRDNLIRQAYGSGIQIAGTTIQDVYLLDNIIDEFGYTSFGATIGSGAWAGITFQNGTRIVCVGNFVRAGSGAGSTDECDYGILAGGGSGVDSWADSNVCYGTFDTAAFQLTSSAGEDGAGTTNWVGKNNFDRTAGHYKTPTTTGGAEYIPTLPDNDTTPSVKGSDVWLCNNSGATTITAFDDGYLGQIITIKFATANTAIADSGNFKLSAAFNSTADDYLMLQNIGSNVWAEISRSAN